MDPSTPPTPNAQNQTPSDQPVNTVPPKASAQGGQPPTSLAQLAQQATPVQSHQQQTPVSVPGSIEEGGAVMQESPDAQGDAKDKLQAAPQEAKTQAVSQQGGVDQEEVAEIQSSIPEVVASSPEVAKIVEQTPPDEPKLSQEVKNAGVTHSGLGTIDVPQKQNGFPAKIPPVPFDVAVKEEKQTPLHDSKHWLMGMFMYIWRRVNPNMMVKKEAEGKGEPVKKVQAPGEQTQQVNTKG